MHYESGTGGLSSVTVKVVQIFESVDENLWCGIQIKATEQYVPVVLFVVLYKVGLT